ncbi:MAG: hypothetical protein IJY42_02695 [Clostridia bacterium]|nr:hypothetical protein [Clostridia bacterium]
MEELQGLREERGQVNPLYVQAYMDGYTAAMEKKRDQPPYLDVHGIINRYGGIGINKAREIMQAVRHTCNGGRLKSSGMILLSEMEYWESIVDKTYLERL